MKQLNGKVAVITGAGSGIGRALAYWLSKEKAVLALADIDLTGLQATQSLINADSVAPGAVQLYQVDMAKRDQVYEFAHQVKKQFGQVDLLINNAGVSSSGRIEELTYATLEWTININLWGVIYGTKAFLPYLKERSEAAIVNLSSVYGLMGIPGQAAYCASKFAVRGFSEALRQDLYHTPITVSIVYPGGVKTNIAKNSRTDYPLSPADYAQHLERFEATNLKTSPDEAAQAIIHGIKNKAPRILIGKDARKIDFLARFKPNSYDKVIAKQVEG